MKIIDYDIERKNRDLNIDNLHTFNDNIITVTKKTIISLLKNDRSNKVRVMILGDMHGYTFKHNGKKGYAALLLMLRRYNIKYLILAVSQNAEYRKVISTVSNQISKCFIISHKIDPSIYNDYKLPKIYDILLYGVITKKYPFRKRLYNILLKMRRTTKLRIRIISKSNNIKGRNLSKLINRSWICIATPSQFNYLVKKYFEISACKSVIAGNMPAQGKSIFENNYIPLTNNLGDKTIISRLTKAVRNKEKLKRISEHMYQVIHKEHTIKNRREILADVYNEVITNVVSINDNVEQTSVVKKPLALRSTRKPIALRSTRKPVTRKLVMKKPITRKRLVKKPIVKKPIALRSTRKRLVKKPISREGLVRKNI